MIEIAPRRCRIAPEVQPLRRLFEFKPANPIRTILIQYFTPGTHKVSFPVCHHLNKIESIFFRWIFEQPLWRIPLIHKLDIVLNHHPDSRLMANGLEYCLAVRKPELLTALNELLLREPLRIFLVQCAITCGAATVCSYHQPLELRHDQSSLRVDLLEARDAAVVGVEGAPERASVALEAHKLRGLEELGLLEAHGFVEV